MKMLWPLMFVLSVGTAYGDPDKEPSPHEKAVAESKERAFAKYPDLRNKSSDHYKAAERTTASWRMDSAWVFKQDNWPEQVAEAAHKVLLKNQEARQDQQLQAMVQKLLSSMTTQEQARKAIVILSANAPRLATDEKASSIVSNLIAAISILESSLPSAAELERRQTQERTNAYDKNLRRLEALYELATDPQTKEKLRQMIIIWKGFAPR